MGTNWGLARLYFAPFVGSVARRGCAPIRDRCVYRYADERASSGSRIEPVSVGLKRRGKLARALPSLERTIGAGSGARSAPRGAALSFYPARSAAVEPTVCSPSGDRDLPRDQDVKRDQPAISRGRALLGQGWC
jgi:hypothetical protein